MINRYVLIVDNEFSGEYEIIRFDRFDYARDEYKIQKDNGHTVILAEIRMDSGQESGSDE